MEIMYHRKNGKRYEVYQYIFVDNHSYALCYDTDQAGQCGQGWCRMRLKDLVPEAHANPITGQFMSTTERNKVKRHLKLVAATWQAEDGTQFDHEHIEDAIEYQRQLMKANAEATNEGH